MATKKTAPAPASPPAPEFTVEFLDPRTMDPHPLQYKTHSDRLMADLDASLKEFGWLSAPILNRRTNHVLDGHERRQDAIDNGWPLIPVRVIDVPPAREKRILAAFDRLGELRQRDDRLLAALLRDIGAEAGDDALPVPGYTEAETDDLLALLDAPAELPPEATGAFYADNANAARAQEQAEQGPYVSHVRLVNLYLSLEQHGQVMTEVEALAERYGTANVTDTIVAAIHAAWEHADAGDPAA